MRCVISCTTLLTRVWKKPFQTLEQERTQADVESAQLLAEAQDKAAKVKKDAERHIAKMRSKLQEDRAAFEEESAEIMRKLLEDRTALEEAVTSMEKAQTFQTSKILLNVGGHRFETSLQSLTSVPHTYFASLFSGRFELTSDAKGAYFIDRDGKNFYYILNFLRVRLRELQTQIEHDGGVAERRTRGGVGILRLARPHDAVLLAGTHRARAVAACVSHWHEARAVAGSGSGACARV
jgi:hypothetical protein